MGTVLRTQNATGRENRMDNSMMKQSNKEWMKEYWNLATWNVRGLSRKLEEVIQELGKRKIDVVVISETKKKDKVRWN
jgi:hypothetical protein